MKRRNLQKKAVDKVEEWRKRSTQWIGVYDPYQPATHSYDSQQKTRAKNDDILRINDKYANNAKDTIKANILLNTPTRSKVPTRPERRKKYGNNLYPSKSETDLLSAMNDSDAPIDKDTQLNKEAKYEFKTCLPPIHETDTYNNNKSNWRRKMEANDNRIWLARQRVNDDYIPERHSHPQTHFQKNGRSFSSHGLNSLKRSDPKVSKSSLSLFSKSKMSLFSKRMSLGNLFKKSTSQTNLKRGHSEPYLDEISFDSVSISDEKCGNKKTWRNSLARFNFVGRLKERSKSRSNLSNISELSPCSSAELRRRRRRVQEADNNFFELFGSQLRQKSVKQAEEEAASLAPIQDDSSCGEPECSSKRTAHYEATPDGDSGIETPHETDSENEETERLLLCEESVGMNIDELYSEVLYEILHSVGGGDAEVGQQAMFNYVQEAFQMTVEQHTELLEEASRKEPPEIMLNVQVIEAKQLLPKDSNGTSDPFVTLYLASNPSRKYNSSVKCETLNPTWEEYFSLEITKELKDDKLCIEVWDFDAAETVGDKMGKLFKVKGASGMRKWLKEVTVAATTGKHDSELIGTASVPFTAIQAQGLTMWYSLVKKNKLKNRGVIQLALSFSAKKNTQVSVQEHRHLLRILLLHELEISKVAHYWWSGTFSAPAEAILVQHIAQGGLSSRDNLLSQWSAFCGVTLQHPLSLSLFVNLLDKLNKHLKSRNITKEDLRIFWDATRKLLPDCFNIIRRLRRKKNITDKDLIKMLKDTLSILNRISALDKPIDVDIFPPNVYVWVKEDKLTLESILIAAIKYGAEENYVHILQGQNNNGNEEEAGLENLIRIVKLIRSDLQKAVEYYNTLFVELMNIPYTKILYGVYEKKLANVVESEVLEVSKKFKRLNYHEELDNNSYIMLADGLNGGKRIGAAVVEDEPMTMGTKLFELYLALRRFLLLGKNLNEEEWRNYSIANFHQWFSFGVAQWLDMAAYKAKTRIDRAIQLDTLTPVDSYVKHSSSPVDTMGIFEQIKIFWQELDWPDVEESYTFIAKIIEDIRVCCVYYSDRMSSVVSQLAPAKSTFGNDKFQVTTEWCTAVNNMDYVCASLTPFVNALGLDNIVSCMCDAKSPMEASRYRETLENVLANAIDTMRNKLVELLEILVKKMMPWVARFLLEGAEVYNTDCASMDRVMLYLNDNLQTLDSNMSEDNFKRVLQLLWEQLSELLYELIQTNIEKRRPPSFFANLYECVFIMIESFEPDSKGKAPCRKLADVLDLLKLYGMETQELIHQYHLERWREQRNSQQTSQLGQLTIRAQFTDHALYLEILNARDLKASDSNGFCDSFVRVQLLPEEEFAEALKPKTQMHKKNRFPLYDEIFQIPLTTSQRSVKDGLLQFTVKDKDLFTSEFLGEAYVHFDEIPSAADPRMPTLATLPQVHLILNRPEKLVGVSIKALETRTGDKMALEFIKKQRAKMT